MIILLAIVDHSQVFCMFSRRVEAIKESGTLKVTNKAKALKAEGVDVVSFAAGEPDFDTPSHIVDAAKQALDAGFTRYVPMLGIPELRKAIAEKSSAENGIPCDMANVMVTPTKHALFMAVSALVDRGDEVILSNPSWVSNEAFVGFSEGVVKYIPVTAENDFRLTPETVAEAVTDKTCLIMLNSPSNPMGSVAELDDLKGIAEIAIDKDLFVISDEIYEKLIYDGKHHSIASLDGMFERTITVNGFSKSYAMTGWRLGWMVAAENMIKGIGKVQSHSVTCATSFAQKGGVAALTGPQDDLKKMQTAFSKRRKLMVDGLNKIDGFHCTMPKGAFYAFPRYDFEISSEKLALHLLEKSHVATIPGSAFGSNGEGHIRLSYATSEEAILKGLERIEDAVGEL